MTGHERSVEQAEAKSNGATTDTDNVHDDDLRLPRIRDRTDWGPGGEHGTG